MSIRRTFDRLPPPDWRHVERYPLTRATIPEAAVPVVIGINWYGAFDDPKRDTHGAHWIRNGYLGPIRGGHCVALEPGHPRDLTAFWNFYNQGREGACVGFGCSRMMSILNRVRYDAQWLYHEAQKIDQWVGEQYEGTSVRAGLEVLRTRGHRRIIGPHVGAEKPDAGIAAYRWAQTVDEVHAVLQNPAADERGAVPILNSWGRDGYPHRVWMEDAVLARLLAEDGEVGLVTDR